MQPKYVDYLFLSFQDDINLHYSALPPVETGLDHDFRFLRTG